MTGDPPATAGPASGEGNDVGKHPRMFAGFGWIALLLALLVPAALGRPPTPCGSIGILFAVLGALVLVHLGIDRRRTMKLYR